ncbi:MAG: hypothetical protein QOH42_2275, partial [Blastocatellia bacterium]|nr:hypothetical protein [Blastocatellia bacterium]
MRSGLQPSVWSRFVFLSVNGFLHLHSISVTPDLHLSDSSFNSLEVLSGQFNTGSADILRKSMNLGCARYGYDPGFLCQ